MKTQQIDLFAAASPFTHSVSETPDIDAIRKRLSDLLAAVKTAQSLPWDANRTRVHEIIFPQMARWLPAQEGADLTAAFAKELKRLRLKKAA